MNSDIEQNSVSDKRDVLKKEINKQDKIDTPKEKSHIGSAITIATLATVGGIFMISRGFQKNASKFLNKTKDYFESKQELSALNSNRKRTKFYEYAVRKTNSFIKKSESINNVTSAKDILFMKLMYKTKPTKELHQAITNYFEKLSRQTVLDSYKKTAKDFDKMNQVFDRLDEFILQNSPNEIINYKDKDYTKKELIAKAKEYRETADLVVKNFMSESALKFRYEYINKVTSTLYSRFWDASFKDFWSKDNKFKRKEMWQTFIAAEQIKGDKTKLAEWVTALRYTITYNNKDKQEIMQNALKKLDGIIPPSDREGIDIIKKLGWFLKYSEGYKNNKELFLDELLKLENHKIPIYDESIAKTQEECKNSNIQIIRSLIDDDATGELQDMLSIYYKLAPFELEKSGALLALKRSVKSFDTATYYESVEFFDKVRDLKLGSAPTDILTILFSFIALSAGLGHAKDKDRRTSVMLKSGIPIAGGIAAAIYTATKMVSGGKSLAFGFISGIVLNQLGIIADNIRKRNIKTEEV